MPIHDWTRVRANRFHDFHLSWTVAIRDALNRGLLPDGYFALAEQTTGGPSPDVVTLSVPTLPSPAGGIGLDEARPQTRHVTPTVATLYATKANRVAVHHPDGTVVAVIEIVSPGNKGSRHAINSFTRKAAAFLRAGVHLLILDLFPPSKRDPQGVHPLIWGRVAGEDDGFALPPSQPLTLASYAAGANLTGYVQTVGVGEALPEMPVFLRSDRYVSCPLEATYQAAWAEFRRCCGGRCWPRKQGNAPTLDGALLGLVNN